MLTSIAFFVLAGLAEIGGGYLVWLWLREDKPIVYGMIGGILVIIYAVIPTLQKVSTFGRVYAAYGGIFVVLSIFWGWFIDNPKKLSENLLQPVYTHSYSSSTFVAKLLAYY